jgi:hypothetical protein
MKNRFALSVLAASLAAAGALPAPAASLFEAPRPSPKGTVTQRVGLTDLAVTYSRPSVKGRKIFGELVPLDKPWRTGANEATTITLSDDVKVNGSTLPAGTYAIVTIPGKDEWTVAFNRDTKLFSETEYDAAKDVLRVKATPTAIGPVESLRISFPALTETSALLAIEWDTVKVAVAIEVEVTQKALAAAKTLGQNAKADDWETPLASARYLFDKKADRAEAWKLLEKSIKANKNYFNTARKARILAEDGKTAEAVAAGEDAIKLAKASPDKPNTTAFEKTVAEWKEKAAETAKPAKK